MPPTSQDVVLLQLCEKARMAWGVCQDLCDPAREELDAWIESAEAEMEDEQDNVDGDGVPGP